MPSSGLNQKVVDGAAQFVKTTLEDLLDEVRLGKHQDFESAIILKIEQIVCATYLGGMTETATGSLGLILGAYQDLLFEVRGAEIGATHEGSIDIVVAKTRYTLSILHIDEAGNLAERRPDTPELVAARIDSANFDDR